MVERPKKCKCSESPQTLTDKNLSEIEVALWGHAKTETFNFFPGDICLGTVNTN